MDFLEELEWRGMLHDKTPGIKEALASGKVVGYIGFDPTAPSLTIGNYVQLMLLSFFQKSGHQPIVLMGGATGRIGDPSGKDKERVLKTEEELDSNLHFQLEQAKRFLDFDCEGNPALIVNNYDFYKDMNVLEFLRKVGKNLTVSYMMSKDSVKNRLETGLSFTEFSYQLLQAYDFQCLYEQYNCILQMGGSDQWGNITSGTEFIRRNIEDGKAYAVTTPLLTKSDGSKFGKSSDGNIWLDPTLTSPYKFYQYWLKSDDRDLPKFMRYFSFKTKEEILQLEEDFKEDLQSLKKLFAEEITKQVHGDLSFKSAQMVSELIFNKKLNAETLKQMSAEDLLAISYEIPSKTLSNSLLASSPSIVDLLVESVGIYESNSALRRAIKGNALSVNKVKVQDYEMNISNANLLQNQYLLVENGKKEKHLIVFN